MGKSKGKEATGKYAKGKPVWSIVYPKVCECGKSNEHFRNWKWHLWTAAALLALFLSVLPFCFSSPNSEVDAYVITHDSAQEAVFVGGQQACNGNAE